ncbi:MAG: hypothetical protein HY393_03670 [Candidatus Diapherotrites archaeon]|nr:hypothetical protein [Candidatus Diapherotrites archaeon]
MEDAHEEAREKKLQELKKKFMERQQEEQELHAQQQMEGVLRKILSPEAKNRLSNVRLVNPERYAQTVQYLLYAAQAGRIQQRLSEQELVGLLAKLSHKKEISIRRK